MFYLDILNVLLSEDELLRCFIYAYICLFTSQSIGDRWRWLTPLSRSIFYRTGVSSALGNTLADLHLHFNGKIGSVQWKSGGHIKITSVTPSLHNIWELFLPRVNTMQDRIICPPPPLCRIWKRQGSDLPEFLAPFDLAVLGDQAFLEDCKDFLLSSLSGNTTKWTSPIMSRYFLLYKSGNLETWENSFHELQ